MYFQEPSLLSFQRRMEEGERRNNLRSMFGVEKIPKDSQLREVLDEFSPEHLSDVFDECFYRLQRGKHLEQFRFLGDSYLIKMDGTQFFCSDTVHCEQCLETREHTEGAVRYGHKSLQLALVHPGIKQVIPLAPEEIANTDGRTKQDCELNAAKRAVVRLRRTHPQLEMTLVADGLFSKQPMIELVRKKRMHFVFVAKPADHPYLMEYVSRSAEIQEKVIRCADEKTHRYRWVNDAPLSGREDALSVNYFSFEICSETEVTYRNSWVTDHAVTEQNIEQLVCAGRARWKIENECFNTLKNKGYNLEHNYGHGKKYLCFNFYLLILLAFLFHQIFELTDELYQECLRKEQIKREFWESLRALVKRVFFDSWETLLRLIAAPDRFVLKAVPGP
jgi:hypothetical protein